MIALISSALACGKDNVAGFGGGGTPAEMNANESVEGGGEAEAAESEDTSSSSEDTGASAGAAGGGDDDADGGTAGGGSGSIESFDVTNFTFGECVDGETTTTLEVTYDESGGHVQVRHNAHQANCCAEFGLTATGSTAGQISVVYADSGMECNCICGFDLRYRLVGLPSGSWSVRVPDGLSASVTIP